MAKPDFKQLKNDLLTLHQAAIRAADPKAAVERYLDWTEEGALRVGSDEIELDDEASVWIVALGKGSIKMTEAAIEILGERVAGGVVTHPKQLSAPKSWNEMKIRSFGAGHPLPDEKSLAAGDAAAELGEQVAEGDLVLALVSGGGSALLEKLRPGLTLETLQPLTKALQHAGADIIDLNVVRRAISLTKGGGLARMMVPARIATLSLSDVLDDRPETIASGPTVPSPTGPEEAVEILKKYKLDEDFPAVLEAVEAIPEDDEEGDLEENGPPSYHLVGTNRLAGLAVVEEAEKLGFQARFLTTHLQGEASEVGRMIGGLASSVRIHGVPIEPPACLVLGGETTVTVKGEGRGGRNLEVALGAAIALDGVAKSAVVSFATDGVDGSSDAAGAFATGESLERCRSLKLSPREFLERNDSWALFQALGNLWVTGPTGTNVNDLSLVLVYP